MKVCIVPRVHGVGGMVSFRDRLVSVLERQGVEVTQELSDFPYQAVLVIGGTRQLNELRKARRRGIPIVQRLDGLNWLHRLPPSASRPRFSLRHLLRAELANLNLALIRHRFATVIVYQSQFAKHWWEQAYGVTYQPHRVIYNGVDLSQFTPIGEHQRPLDRLRILMVEGSLGGGYEWGLQVAIHLLEELFSRQDQWRAHYPQGLELMVVGQVAESIRQNWERKSKGSIIWQGRVAATEIPFLDRSAHLLYSADIHPACPNAVIEALACGLPVLAFSTGALPELVTPECGRVVPYGGDAWRLDEPDIPSLAKAGLEIALQQEELRAAARARAERFFDVNQMAKAYAEVLGISLTPQDTATRQEKPSQPLAPLPKEEGERTPSNPSAMKEGKSKDPFLVFLGSLGDIFLSKSQVFWFTGLGKLSRFTPLFLKRLVYRLPRIANWLRTTVNRSVGPGLQWVEITAGGLQGLSLYLDLSQEKDYWLGTYEPELQMAIQELVYAGQVAYDVGANVGYVTLLLARRVGRQGKVIAFEPFPQNVQRLKQNVAANAHLAPMEVMTAAVVDVSHPVTFLVGPSDDTGRVADHSVAETPDERKIVIEGIALDHLVFERGYPPPQVIKIDVEGGEIAALNGMQRLLAEVHPLILLETHNQTCTETAWEILTHFGYQVCWMKKGYPTLNRQAALPRRAYLVALPPK